MSAIDDILKANRSREQQFNLSDHSAPPRLKLAVVACMDARLTMEGLGIEVGDAHIIRNAGGIVTEDAIRSLIISHHLLGTQEFMVINHTDCGMLSFKGHDLRQKLEKETGVPLAPPIRFHAFDDLEENVIRQLERIRSHPWLPDTITARGFIFDVKTGKLSEVAG